MRKLIFPSNVTNMTAVDFFELVTFNTDEIVEKVEITGGELGKTWPFTSHIDPTNTSFWTNHSIIDFGRCYSFSLSDISMRSNRKVRGKDNSDNQNTYLRLLDIIHS